MGLKSKKKKAKKVASAPVPAAAAGNRAEVPQLARRRANRQSTLKSGRTIGEKREKLETANERRAAREKAKRRKRARVITVSVIFVALAACLVAIYLMFTEHSDSLPITTAGVVVYQPTVEIVDEDGSSAGGEITNWMREYVGQAEVDFRDLGYKVVKAVVPAGSIREVDLYLDGQPGYVKMLVDRDSAPSTEDADRLIRYLQGQGITSFEYIDVRLPKKAYWR